MGLGGTGTGKAWNLRNRLGFTMRSAVHSLRAVPFLAEASAGERIWSLFLARLKKGLVEDHYTARLNGDLGEFERRVLVGGILGRLDGSWADGWGGI